MGVDALTFKHAMDQLMPAPLRLEPEGRLRVALRVWLRTERGCEVHIASHIDENAIELVGAVGGFTIGETVAVGLQDDNQRRIVLPACVHRADNGRCVLWFDRPTIKAGAALDRFVNDLRLQRRGPQRRGLYHFLHAA